MLTEIVILDTAKMSAGPIAIIELPFRLRAGIHGSWVMGKDLPEDKELCDMHGVTEEIMKEFGRPSSNRNGASNGSKSTNGHS